MIERKKLMKLIVSLNRYEKNLDLAVLNFIYYISKYVNKNNINNSCLVVTGGYDSFLKENFDIYNKLNSYIDNTEKKSMNIFFLRNIDNNESSILIEQLISFYIPQNLNILLLYLCKPCIVVHGY